MVAYLNPYLSEEGFKFKANFRWSLKGRCFSFQKRNTMPASLGEPTDSMIS
jgi:hypothetical protein